MSFPPKCLDQVDLQWVRLVCSQEEWPVNKIIVIYGVNQDALSLHICSILGEFFSEQSYINVHIF